MAASNRALPPGMLAYLGPAALSILFINHAGASHLMAVHRLQVRARVTGNDPLTFLDNKR